MKNFCIVDNVGEIFFIGKSYDECLATLENPDELLEVVEDICTLKILEME